MRFLLAVIDTASNTATGDEGAAIDAFNDSLEANGHWIIACGIDSPSSASVVDNRLGAGLITDGPLLNSEEYMSGFWLINAESYEQAIALAVEGSKACNRKVEVRPLLR
jgi:hypothetical protein